MTLPRSRSPGDGDAEQSRLLIDLIRVGWGGAVRGRPIMIARSRAGAGARPKRSAVTSANRESSPSSCCARPPPRARETLERIEPTLGRGDVCVEPGLCGAPPAVLLARLREIPVAVRSVIVIGHNPGLQELALVLAHHGSSERELEAKFPTGALAMLAFRGSGWHALDRGVAELIDFIRPRDLDR